ncbi:hypothetical protein ABEP12_02115 [Bacillus velezensis]
MREPQFLAAGNQEEGEKQKPKRKTSKNKKKNGSINDPKVALVKALLEQEGLSYDDWLDEQHTNYIFSTDNIERTTEALNYFKGGAN